MNWRVSSQESGWTLQQFLRHVLPNFSAKSIKRQLEQHRCQVNGRLERFSSAVVGTGDEIVFNPIESSPKATPLTTLYDDVHIKIISKPSGVTSESFAQPGLVLVHRLDKPTSGVFILAKSDDTYRKMVEIFRQKSVEKTYLALVAGVPSAQEGKVENYLGKLHEMGGQAIWGAVEKGQYALTYWKTIQKGKKGALLEIKPITGRTHQIRTHLASLKLPIVGDAQYGAKGTSILAPRVMLHAYRIQFPHPHTAQVIDVKATVPEDFLKQMQLMGLRWDDAI